MARCGEVYDQLTRQNLANSVDKEYQHQNRIDDDDRGITATMSAREKLGKRKTWFKTSKATDNSKCYSEQLGFNNEQQHITGFDLT